MTAHPTTNPPAPTEPPDQRPDLGDGYRVDARIVTWQRDDALRVPINALFRDNGHWAVFAIDNGRARNPPDQRRPADRHQRAGD